MEDKLLFSEEAEKQIIGVCLVNPDTLHEVELSAEDFYIDKNRLVFGAMRQLSQSGSKPDYITVIEYLERFDKLRHVGEPYLTQLIAEASYSSYIEGWIRIVSDYATRRRMIESASQLARIAYDTDKPFIEPLADVVDNLATGAKPRHGAVHWGESLSEYYDWLEERSKNPGELWGIPTGFIEFDRMTGGIQSGDLIYIAGEPGIGKTILSTQMGLQMSRANFPGALYSLEMAKRAIIGRILSGMTQVESRLMKSGRMTDANWLSVTQAIEQATKYPLFLSDDGTLTTTQLRADLARLKSRHGIMWCVLDYDMLLNDGDGRMDEIQFSTVVSKRLKAIAKDLDIALITVSSVTKDTFGDEGAPTMKGIRGGAQKIHNADVAGFLTKHLVNKGSWEVENPNLRTFTFVKGRELPSLGRFNLVKFDKYPAFGDLEKPK